ncbi:DNA topoisomerase III [Marinomonas ostreistagni]|uniref:DNA topoisomerase III n=1 Tax=Marinomonas ostreistagni TaxID=359209 RepID=UPI0019514006|nr:DNA topoisomerase III [Marinomonas ostreistagni]MBM6549549.1 DNA topoisomerase III [Marinomonas ostreistagni]
MILYIAEKPSLARAIASALPNPQKKHDGYIELPNGDCVTWCIGHLLELAEPQDYAPHYKQWSLDHLPIVPDDWQWKAKANTKKQLAVVKRLLKQANQIVHAGDPDREGQLLVDEVLHFSKVSKAKLEHTQRLLISDLTLPAVKKALNQLRPNKEFAALSRSALARSRADWLYGINLTRAYTVKGRQAGYQGVLSVGRVQTPVLGLVVRRDKERAEFVPKAYYQVIAHLLTEQQQSFQAKWQPSKACEPYQDEEGRVLSKPLAENVARRITDKPATVTGYDKSPKKQTAPLPYNLSALQIDAAKAFSMSAQKVLDTCQALYERHQMITYPRSDCRYLPTEQFKQATTIVGQLKKLELPFQNAAQDANPQQKSKAWNDKQVGAHHAIIPTSQLAAFSKLNSDERRVFELIARQYLIQFLPAYEYLATKIHVTIEGGEFTTSGVTVTKLGWKALMPANKKEQPELPSLIEGQTLHCQKGEVLDKETTPPDAFTDATLLAAMTGISRFVTAADIKAILKETDGLGTEATRASIIELLFKRGFLQRDGKQIHATATGTALIEALPEQTTVPDMTAKWEAMLDGISKNTEHYQTFMDELVSGLNTLVTTARSGQLSNFSNLPQAPKRGTKKRYSRKPKRTKKTT